MVGSVRLRLVYLSEVRFQVMASLIGCEQQFIYCGYAGAAASSLVVEVVHT